MFRYCSIFIFILAVAGCDDNPKVAVTKAARVDTAAKSDTSSYENSWNLGDNIDEPEKAVDTRFVVRVKLSRSRDVLRVFLDSAPAGSTSFPGSRQFFPADSIEVTGLRRIDSFTQGCTYGSAPWEPRIAILPDTVYERWGRPRFIWVLDTVKVRIRPLPTDSASCFIGTPD